VQHTSDLLEIRRVKKKEEDKEETTGKNIMVYPIP